MVNGVLHTKDVGPTGKNGLIFDPAIDRVSLGVLGVTLATAAGVGAAITRAIFR